MAAQQWYYRKDNARFGPVSSSELKKLAASGELAPTDLLRGIGMSEWVPASKIKGLFSAPKPKAEEELGLSSAVRKPKAEPPKPESPTPRTLPAQPVAPATPPEFTVAAPEASNPFAQFGLEQGSGPFAAAPDFGLPTNDPFAGMGSGGTASSPFDNLASLGSQGQAIYREPSPQATGSDPFAKADKPKAVASASASESAGAGPLGAVGLLAAPFAVMGILGFVCGVICAFPPGIIVYFIVSGASKMAGMFAGNCLLKAKIKNEILSLGYGGLLGIFTSYIFLGGVFWAVIKFDRWVNQTPKEPARVSRQADEDGGFFGLEPDRPVSFSEPDDVPMTSPAPVVEAEPVIETKTPPIDEDDPFGEKEETKTVPINEDDPFGEAADASPPKITPDASVTPRPTISKKPIEDEEDEEEAGEDDELTPEQRKQLEEFQAQMENMESDFDKLVRKLERGVSPLESLNPLFIIAILIIAPLFTLINTGLWICITAHSTWTANLGYDPTKSGGF